MNRFFKHFLGHENEQHVVSSFVRDGLMQYDLIFSSPRVIGNLSFCWVYHRIFGVYPSVIDMKSMHDLVDIKRHIFSISFYKFVQYDNPALDAQFAQHVHRLKTDKAFIKHEIFKLIKDGVNPHWNESEYDSATTLYTQYTKIVAGSTNPYMTYSCDAGHLEANPLTGFMVPMPAIENQEISIYDLLKAIYIRDNYLCRLFYQGPTFIAFEKMQSVAWNDRNQINVAFGVDESIRQLCATAFVVDKNDLKDAMVAMPHSISKQCIVYGAASGTALPHAVVPIPSFTKNHDEIFDILMRACVFKSIHMPIKIQECIIDLFELSYVLDTTSHKHKLPNCVLLIDSRENMFSVMSAAITLSNLRANMWNLVIMTSETSRPFYARWFPDAIFIQDMKGKFNIETYNRMLKDEHLWEQLANLGFKNCLTVQDDAVILRPGMEDVFLDKYDYVGAPWLPAPFLKAAGITDDYVGNGGLSLRNISCMLDICKTCDPKDKMRLFNNEIQPEPEDVFFSAQVAKRKGRIPNHQLASRFAMEQIVNMDAFGLHKPWPYVGEDVVIKIMQNREQEIRLGRST